MVTACVSAEQVALLLEPEERRPLRELVEASLRAEGLRPWAEMELELYPGAGGELLLARPRPPRRSRISPDAPRLRRNRRARG